jgi:hypothetical protein
VKGNIMARLTVAQMEAALKAAGHEVSTELELGGELGLATAKLAQWLSAKAEATKVEAEGFAHGFKVGYAYQRKLGA